ncbi:MAG: 4-hydroxythreonine-4-phosphate dehydrogenase PdxA [Gammaproteobacteria bacterium]|nr:4-hydroxythreonine-4-phosphate dehydrogenase PdxA [Gammaproteobacteria bacterium]|tara:strand:- start:6213 stop:7115 length:903 start_codon:yes stop_codon:yes gene_type:complete
MKLNKPLVITAGEPAGIGPKLCSSLVNTNLLNEIVVIGDASLLDDKLKVIDTPFPAPVKAGCPDPRNAKTLLEGLEIAVKGCLSNKFSGMVTAPIAKNVIADAGISFTGHTEFLANLTNVDFPVMLLVANNLRVALASTHIPLRDVPDFITKERLIKILCVLQEDLKRKFQIKSPEILVCGLNPHAGESGHIGKEDEEIIAPVVKELAKSGMKVRGPISADTAFTAASGHKDAILAMYHDQGLPTLKFAGFGHSVNVTLGLPIIRTSVDHGTAFDLANSDKADATSLIAAIELAKTLASN